MLTSISSSSEREMVKDRVGGIIMSGGRSRRMNGEVKALLPINGQPIIKKIALEMVQLCSTVTVSVSDMQQAELYSKLGFSVTIDERPNCGPLVALHSTLKAAVEPLVWVSACDMPFASRVAADWMFNKLEHSGSMAIIPEIGGRLHPLQAVYRRECVETTKLLTEAGERRMHKLLNRLSYAVMTEKDCREAGVDVSFVSNVNTPEQYKKIISAYHS